MTISPDPVAVGYWNDAKATAKLFTTDSEGIKWLKTGDLVSCDEEGYLKIKGRVKDQIIRGGENISPVAIENICL